MKQLGFIACGVIFGLLAAPAQAAIFTAMGSDQETLLFLGMRQDEDPLPRLVQVHTGSFRTVVATLPEQASGGRVLVVIPRGKRIFVVTTLTAERVGLFLYDRGTHAWKFLSEGPCPYAERVTPGSTAFTVTCRTAKRVGEPRAQSLDLAEEPFSMFNLGEIKIPQLKAAEGLMTAALESDTLDWDRLRIEVDGRMRVLPSDLPKPARAPHQLKK